MPEMITEIFRDSKFYYYKTKCQCGFKWYHPRRRRKKICPIHSKKVLIINIRK